MQFSCGHRGLGNQFSHLYRSTEATSPYVFVRRFAALLVFASALASTAYAADTIRVGVSCPMSGGSSDMGISLRNGVQLAADEINGWAGGALGKKIELVIRDDKADNAIGKQVAEDLVREQKVSATIGICNAGVGLASLDAYQNGKVPLLIAVSAGTPLAERLAATPDFYVFRNAPRDEIQAEFLVREALKRGLRRIAVFADTSAYGESGLSYVKKALAEQKLAPVSVQRFPIGVTSLAEQATEAKASGADAVLAWTVGPEAAVIAKSVARQKWPVQIFGSWPLSWRNFIDGSGPAAEGTLVAVSFVQQAGFQTRNAFILAYQKKYGTGVIPAPMAAAQGYDAMMIVYQAILQARSDEPVKIKAALENLDRPIAGAVTTYQTPFSKTDHDAISENMLVLGIVRQGQIDYANREDAMKTFSVQRKSVRPAM
nr:ABC transporter substrate-binding protein [Propionivibrio soli]